MSLVAILQDNFEKKLSIMLWVLPTIAKKGLIKKNNDRSL